MSQAVSRTSDKTPQRFEPTSQAFLSWNALKIYPISHLFQEDLPGISSYNDQDAEIDGDTRCPSLSSSSLTELRGACSKVSVVQSQTLTAYEGENVVSAGIQLHLRHNQTLLPTEQKLSRTGSAYTARQNFPSQVAHETSSESGSASSRSSTTEESSEVGGLGTHDSQTGAFTETCSRSHQLFFVCR